jgi:pSer/pThr/pTyr-binding forkhead associated (FHA) protein
MAKLLLKYEGVTISTYELDNDRVTIGRRSDNDIQLDDPAVSGTHACIWRRENKYLDGYHDYYIEDLGSTNGTKVNDQKSSSQMLKDGDLIQMGSHTFMFDSGHEGGMETTAIFIPDD